MGTIPRGTPGGRAILVAALIVGSAVLLATPPAAADEGGPDSYGYIWVDSRLPSPTVSYSWVDIVSRGTRLSLRDDQCTFEVPMGFQFKFYGTITSDVYICANGFLTFDVPDNNQPVPPIPSTAAPNNRVVGLGLDLNPDPGTGGGGAVYYFSDAAPTPRRFVISWIGVYKYATTTPETFQIILEQNETTKDGRILMQYRAMNAVTPMPLVGIENKTGTSGITYPGPLANNLAVAFYPPSDAGLPPDQLRVAWTRLAPDTVEQGTSNVPMVRLDLTTPTNWVDISTVRVVLSGLRAGPEDVTRARLWHDTDGDGILTPGVDLPIAQSTFAGTPPTAVLQPADPVRVVNVGTVRVFVTYDVSTTAGAGDWIGARLPDPTFVSVLFPDVVSATNFPVETYAANVRTQIVSSRDTLLLSDKEALLGNVTQWQTDVPALSLGFDADRNFVTLAGLRVRLGGNASASDVWAVKALRDLDGDRDFTPGVDEVLAVAAPSGSPPAALLGFSLQINAGSPERVLLLIDVSPGAVPGHVLNVQVSATDVQLAGGSDIVDPTNFPATTGPWRIGPGTRPTLRLPFDTTPRADGIWIDSEYLLGPDNTRTLIRPAGNGVEGYLVAENSAATLFLAVDAVADLAVDAGDGLAIAFDTDRNGFPTPDADDVFLLNATAGRHLRYSLVNGTWSDVGACTPFTTPACASGFGITAYGRSAHRFYELTIPLATLRISAGATVHVAVAGPPYGGLADAGTRSTWPLLFGTAMPPLAFFGGLETASGVLPNRPPTLAWSGTPGYEADGVDPDAGNETTEFRYEVTYIDADNDAPSLGEPRLHLMESDLEIPGSPFTMRLVNPKGGNFRLGVPYYLGTVLPCGGNYTHRMSARDARGLLANDTETLPGPLVPCPNRPPVLAHDSVSPLSGTSGVTDFTFRVEYTDEEDEPPFPIELFVYRDGSLRASPNLTLTGWLGAFGSYVDGAAFTGTLVFAQAGTNYTFQFRATDGTSVVETAPVLGPYVLPPAPDILGVSGVDMLQDFAVDEGARNVPFLGLLLSPSAEINVTGLKVDLIGTIPESDVLAVSLYRDADGDRRLSGPDERLGTLQPSGRTMTFGLTLRVTAPTFLFLLVDLRKPGVADATVGLEVRDETYVTVGPGDSVAAFPSGYRALAYVNVPPTVQDATVDGHAAGSPGILHILRADATLAWRFSDANAADASQVAYNVSVSEGAQLRWSENRTGTTASVTSGWALVEGQTYRLTIFVFDGRLWSAPSTTFFRRNTPPPAPTLLAPADFATDVRTDPTILWNPVSDADGDAITYQYWVSETPGFLPSMSGLVVAPGATLSLASGTTYYWKVGASDGFEFAGNATVWRFTTGGGPGPVLGEVHGRVLNGTTPLPYALVELLVDNVPVTAQLTATDGTFRFRDLELGDYVARFSAYGFQSTTRAAAVSSAAPVKDLGDVALLLFVPGDGGGGGGTPPPTSQIPLTTVTALLAVALGLSVFSLAIGVRRRRKPAQAPEDPASDPEPTADPVEAVVDDGDEF